LALLVEVLSLRFSFLTSSRYPAAMPFRLPRLLHRWNLSPRAAIAVQRQMAGRVIAQVTQPGFRWVAGVDAAFGLGGTVCVAGVVLWDLETGDMVESQVATRPVRFPYVPGLLTFREAPAVLAALRRLSRAPDVLLCDGHGISHPRRIGIASHLGVLSDLPSIGCAKSVLVGTYAPPARRRGSVSPLMDEATLIGEAVRTQTGVRPVFSSIGHRMDQATATALILACARRFRLPEPTHLADRLVARAKLRLAGQP
jgi:deoxyribonuclease V